MYNTCNDTDNSCSTRNKRAHWIYITNLIQKQGKCICRDHFVNVPSQWKTTLHCNVVSHWLGAYTNWSLYMYTRTHNHVHIYIRKFSIIPLVCHGNQYIAQCGNCISHNQVWWSLVNSLWPRIWVNIGSGNGLLPDGTKPLPEPMLTNDQWGVVAFTW